MGGTSWLVQDPTLCKQDTDPRHWRSLASRWFNCPVSEVVQQACLPDEFVEKPSSADQFPRGIEFGHLSLLQHDDAIRVQDRVDSMRNRDDGTIFEYVAS